MLFWPGVVLDEDLVETRVDILRITERNYSKSKSKAERKDHTARWHSRTVGKPKVMAVREEGESHRVIYRVRAVSIGVFGYLWTTVGASYPCYFSFSVLGSLCRVLPVSQRCKIEAS